MQEWEDCCTNIKCLRHLLNESNQWYYLLILSITSFRLTNFPLNMILFLSNQIHHQVDSQKRWDTLWFLFPYTIELNDIKFSISSYPSRRILAKPIEDRRSIYLSLHDEKNERLWVSNSSKQNTCDYESHICYTYLFFIEKRAKGAKEANYSANYNLTMWGCVIRLRIIPSKIWLRIVQKIKIQTWVPHFWCFGSILQFFFFFFFCSDQGLNPDLYIYFMHCPNETDICTTG